MLTIIRRGETGGATGDLGASCTGPPVRADLPRTGVELWELEWLSRNFKEHKHDPTGVKGIICWKHNWPDLPQGLEVIELSKVVKGR